MGSKVRSVLKLKIELALQREPFRSLAGGSRSDHFRDSLSECYTVASQSAPEWSMKPPVPLSGLSQMAGRCWGVGVGRLGCPNSPSEPPLKTDSDDKEKTFEQISRKARACSHTPDPCCRRVGGYH